jgi:hypothetical protein
MKIVCQLKNNFFLDKSVSKITYLEMVAESRLIGSDISSIGLSNFVLKKLFCQKPVIKPYVEKHHTCLENTYTRVFGLGILKKRLKFSSTFCGDEFIADM